MKIEGKDCLYIKRTTASVVALVASLRMFGIEKVSQGILKCLEETETFLREMDILFEGQERTLPQAKVV